MLLANAAMESSSIEPDPASCDVDGPHATTDVCGRKKSLGRGSCEGLKVRLKHDVPKSKCPICGPMSRKCVLCELVVVPIARGVQA